MNFSQRLDPMLLQEIFQIPFSNNNNKKKRKTYWPMARQKHTLRKQVVIEYLNVWSKLLAIKTEVSRTFPFTLPVTALPVSYGRRLNFCTALSTFPPGQPGLPAATCIWVIFLNTGQNCDIEGKNSECEFF